VAARSALSYCDASHSLPLAKRMVRTGLAGLYGAARVNEGPIVRRIAAAIGTQHHEVEPGQLQSGTGVDELFGGYTSYRDCPCCSAGPDGRPGCPVPLLVAAAKLASWPLRRSDCAVPPQTRGAKLPDMVRRGDAAAGHTIEGQSEFRGKRTGAVG
jgi:hypothetical protein